LVAHPLTALTISLATRQLLVGTARERRERVDYEGLAISEATHRDATSRHPSFLIPHSSFLIQRTHLQKRHDHPHRGHYAPHHGDADAAPTPSAVAPAPPEIGNINDDRVCV